MRMWRAILTAGALAAAAPALGQTVSAQDPGSVAAALKGAGHEVTLGVDDTGDPVVDAVMQGYKIRVLFLDCNEGTHTDCGSVQFFSMFDAEGAGFTAEDAVLFARRYRYAAVSTNANGDPRLRWDIETGAGIPAEVFVASAARFLGTVQAMAAQLYPQTAAAQ